MPITNTFFPGNLINNKISSLLSFYSQATAVSWERASAPLKRRHMRGISSKQKRLLLSDGVQTPLDSIIAGTNQPEK